MRPDEEKNHATPEKEAAFNRYLAGPGPWYAACQNGHAFWQGPDRTTEAEARADANAHDTNRHGGTATALVLNG